MNKSYGIATRNSVKNKTEAHAEEIKHLGYTIVENVFDEKELAEIRKRLDDLLALQETEFGKENLVRISDANMVRCPFAYDDYFMKLAIDDKVLSIVKEVLGSYFVMHLQNGIINLPKQEHHQSSWHRDLPYQDFIISRPLALSALFCIDPFTPETGGTFVLPHSHKMELMPSQEYVDKHQMQVSATQGSVIIFDSMVFHKAGYNSSNQVRRGINHVYTTGILKQQINFPAMLKGKFSDDPFLRIFLGYESEVPASVMDWREIKMKKIKKAGN